LTSDFGNHFEGGFSDCLHCDRSVEKGDGASDDQADEEEAQGIRISEIERDLRFLNEGGDERECCEPRSTDGEAFADGSCGVAHSIETISDFSRFFTHLCHFSNAASVVRDRAIGVDRHGDTDGAKHADRSEADAVEPGEFVGDIDCAGDGEEGDHY